MNKKPVSAIIAAIALLNGVSAFAATEEACYFSNLSNNWDTVYGTPHYASNGGIYFTDGNIHISSLPYGMINEGDIYDICCYNGRIYYTTGPEGSDISMPIKIYSCDIYGGNNILLADNAEAYGAAFIIDNVLYYQEYRSTPGYGPEGYNGGVSRIDLSNLSWKRIVSGGVWLTYCDGDYAYYTDHSNIYAAVDVNGNYVIDIDPGSDEYAYDVFIKGDRTYYILDGGLYERTRNGGNVRLICTVPENSHINNISSNYVYYSQLVRRPGRVNMVAVTNRVDR